ncbi:hypothetical protein QA597_01780 [Marinilabiliaceae bacterium ANBcel2]|nr:hypothetical protein [Marinilabiliaceae bacterium ANBcel2]
MRNIVNSLMILFFGAFVFLSCETNDLIDDIARPGHFAASVYWEVPSTTVSAGDEVEFEAQFWDREDDIELLSVWYGIERELRYTFTCMSGNESVHTFAYDSSGVARERQKIKEYDFSSDLYSEEDMAYIFKNSFPTSHTLRSDRIAESETTELTQEDVENIVPGYIIDSFYETVFPEFDYDMLYMLLVIDNEIVDEEEFNSYFEEVAVGLPDPDTGEQEYEMDMKESSEEILFDYFSQVSFPNMIFDSRDQIYRFNRTSIYYLDAQFSVINGNGVENFSRSATIELL